MNKMFIFLLLLTAVAVFVYMRYPDIITIMKDRVMTMTEKTEKLPAPTEDNLITSLNKALADEWLAYYQYWIGAQIIKGVIADKVKAELLEHAGEELKHAVMLAERIIQLGGMPLLEPKEWYNFKVCGYIKPSSTDTKSLLRENLTGEICAVSEYKKLMAKTEKTDPTTYNMLASILVDEEKHVKDLNELLVEANKA
ncbi:MAG: ferritin-like domain-containing protein [Candidatus Babeliales bacterium]|jgi:bacterioferritin